MTCLCFLFYQKGHGFTFLFASDYVQFHTKLNGWFYHKRWILTQLSVHSRIQILELWFAGQRNESLHQLVSGTIFSRVINMLGRWFSLSGGLQSRIGHVVLLSFLSVRWRSARKPIKLSAKRHWVLHGLQLFVIWGVITGSRVQPNGSWQSGKNKQGTKNGLWRPVWRQDLQ